MTILYPLDKFEKLFRIAELLSSIYFVLELVLSIFFSNLLNSNWLFIISNIAVFVSSFCYGQFYLEAYYATISYIPEQDTLEGKRKLKRYNILLFGRTIWLYIMVNIAMNSLPRIISIVNTLDSSNLLPPYFYLIGGKLKNFIELMFAIYSDPLSFGFLVFVIIGTMLIFPIILSVQYKAFNSLPNIKEYKSKEKKRTFNSLIGFMLVGGEDLISIIAFILVAIRIFRQLYSYLSKKIRKLTIKIRNIVGEFQEDFFYTFTYVNNKKVIYSSLVALFIPQLLIISMFTGLNVYLSILLIAFLLLLYFKIKEKEKESKKTKVLSTLAVIVFTILTGICMAITIGSFGDQLNTFLTFFIDDFEKVWAYRTQFYQNILGHFSISTVSWILPFNIQIFFIGLMQFTMLYLLGLLSVKDMDIIAEFKTVILISDMSSVSYFIFFCLIISLFTNNIKQVILIAIVCALFGYSVILLYTINDIKRDLKIKEFGLENVLKETKKSKLAKLSPSLLILKIKLNFEKKREKKKAKLEEELLRKTREKDEEQKETVTVRQKKLRLYSKNIYDVTILLLNILIVFYAVWVFILSSFIHMEANFEVLSKIIAIIVSAIILADFFDFDTSRFEKEVNKTDIIVLRILNYASYFFTGLFASFCYYFVDITADDFIFSFSNWQVIVLVILLTLSLLTFLARYNSIKELKTKSQRIGEIFDNETGFSALILFSGLPIIAFLSVIMIIGGFMYGNNRNFKEKLFTQYFRDDTPLLYRTLQCLPSILSFPLFLYNFFNPNTVASLIAILAIIPVLFLNYKSNQDQQRTTISKKEKRFVGILIIIFVVIITPTLFYFMMNTNLQKASQVLVGFMQSFLVYEINAEILLTKLWLSLIILSILFALAMLSMALASVIGKKLDPENRIYELKEILDIEYSPPFAILAVISTALLFAYPSAQVFLISIMSTILLAIMMAIFILRAPKKVIPHIMPLFLTIVILVFAVLISLFIIGVIEKPDVFVIALVLFGTLYFMIKGLLLPERVLKKVKNELEKSSSAEDLKKALMDAKTVLHILESNYKSWQISIVIKGFKAYAERYPDYIKFFKDSLSKYEEAYGKIDYQNIQAIGVK